MTRPYRVMVTGSRGWQDRAVIAAALARWHRVGAELHVGDCPSGADLMATSVWRELTGNDPVVYEANWTDLGRRAGHVRNGQLVSAMPDACLAFMRGHTPGTTDAINQAREAGIKTLAHYWPAK